MKIGVFTAIFGDKPLEDLLDYLNELGIEAVELGLDRFREEKSQEEILELVDKYDMTISAISAHGNPIHPQEKRASKDDEDLRKAIKIASESEIKTVTCFSGCPGSSENSEHPNWIVAPWPTEHREALQWQWEEVITPYWKDISERAKQNDVDIGIEMHPNMSVYNPETLLKLKAETNDRIGANFDPSHLYWQGIDPVEAIRNIGERDAIKHFHAKDTRVYDYNSRVNGVLDTKPYREISNRSWIFRSVGYGHSEQKWKDIVSALRMVGYDKVLSIEHEDLLASPEEGLKKAINILKRAVLKEEPEGSDTWI